MRHGVLTASMGLEEGAARIPRRVCERARLSLLHGRGRGARLQRQPRGRRGDAGTVAGLRACRGRSDRPSREPHPTAARRRVRVRAHGQVHAQEQLGRAGGAQRQGDPTQVQGRP